LPCQNIQPPSLICTKIETTEDKDDVECLQWSLVVPELRYTDEIPTMALQPWRDWYATDEQILRRIFVLQDPLSIVGRLVASPTFSQLWQQLKPVN
jgi:hypothetical protein